MDKNESHQPLHKVLREWKPASGNLPRNFQRTVWERIASVESRRAGNPFVLFRAWIEQSLIHPKVAASYLGVVLLFGLATGYTHAQVRTEKMERAQRQAYVQMIDPYQMPR